MARELGEIRDAHLEIERLARASGPILESAVQSLISIHAPFFSQTGPDLRHRLTGQTIEEWVSARRKSNPNDYADYAPDDPEQTLHVTIEEACLTPSPKSVGRLFTLVGETRAKEILKTWDCDWVRMLPGKRPGYAEKKEPTAPQSSSNPYSDNFKGTPEERQQKIGSLISQGIGPNSLAAKLAASAGCSITGAKLVR
jgi:hypothetical protein